MLLQESLDGATFNNFKWFIIALPISVVIDENCIAKAVNEFIIAMSSVIQITQNMNLSLALSSWVLLSCLNNNWNKT